MDIGLGLSYLLIIKYYNYDIHDIILFYYTQNIFTETFHFLPNKIFYFTLVFSYYCYCWGIWSDSISFPFLFKRKAIGHKKI